MTDLAFGMYLLHNVFLHTDFDNAYPTSYSQSPFVETDFVR